MGAGLAAAAVGWGACGCVGAATGTAGTEPSCCCARLVVAAAAASANGLLGAGTGGGGCGDIAAAGDARSESGAGGGSGGGGSTLGALSDASVVWSAGSWRAPEDLLACAEGCALTACMSRASVPAGPCGIAVCECASTVCCAGETAAEAWSTRLQELPLVSAGDERAARTLLHTAVAVFEAHIRPARVAIILSMEEGAHAVGQKGGWRG